MIVVDLMVDAVLAEVSIRNGAVTEKYSVVRDAGDVFIQCCLDANDAGPVDTMRIDRRAMVSLARAFLMEDMRQGLSDAAYVYAGAPEQAPNVVAFRPGTRAIRIEGMAT